MTGILAIAMLAIAAWLIWRAHHNREPDRHGWENLELRTSDLVHIERDLVGALEDGTWLYGRPDRVYRTKQGKHIPVEYKTRKKPVVYRSDVAQLSLQAWLLHKNGYAPAEHGYVVAETPNGRHAMQIKLYGPRQCEELIRRYQAVISGNERPKAERGKRCAGCGHLQRCQMENGG